MARLTGIEHRRGRSWYRLLIDGQAAWVVDREALLFLGLGVPTTTRPAGEGQAEGAGESPGGLVPHDLTPTDEEAFAQAERATARRRALQILGQRARTRAETVRLLNTWPFHPASVEDAVRWLEGLGYLDDRQVALDWVESRMRQRPAGRRLVEAELVSRGIAPATVQDVITTQLPPSTELAQAIELAHRRVRASHGQPSATTARRLWQQLLARGFSPDVARRALVEVMGSAVASLLESSGGWEG